MKLLQSILLFESKPEQAYYALNFLLFLPEFLKNSTYPQNIL